MSDTNSLISVLIPHNVNLAKWGIGGCFLAWIGRGVPNIVKKAIHLPLLFSIIYLCMQEFVVTKAIKSKARNGLLCLTFCQPLSLRLTFYTTSISCKSCITKNYVISHMLSHCTYVVKFWDLIVWFQGCSKTKHHINIFYSGVCCTYLSIKSINE